MQGFPCDWSDRYRNVRSKKEKTMDNTMLFKALREFTSGLLNQLLVNLAGEDGQTWLDEFKKFLRQEPCWVGKVKTYLRRLYETEVIAIGATDGTETLAQAGDVFTGWIDPDFKNWELDSPSVATSPMPVMVTELTKNGTFAEIYKSLGELLDDLCFSQAQIKKFCVEHRSKLSTDYGTFFLFKKHGNFFVADVRVLGGGRLRVRVRRFSFDGVWRAERGHRFVFPQQ